jgi:putative transposase
VNHKRTYRLYSEEGLSMRAKVPRRKRAWRYRVGRPRATAPNEVWAMDFVSDGLFDGRPMRILAVIDAHTREALSIAPRANFRAFDVVAELDRLARERGRPKTLKVDNGPEFAGRLLDQWAYLNGVEIDFSRPGNRRITPTSRPSMAACGRSASTPPGSCPWRMHGSGSRRGGGSTTRNGRTGHWET